jgi:MipA family protein
MHLYRWFGSALIALILILPSVAISQEKPLWELGAGMILLQLPDYVGADRNRLYLLPYPYFIYRGDILDIDKDRVPGRLFKSKRGIFEFSFFGQPPVSSSDNEARQGMPDLDTTFEVGPSSTITLLEGRQRKDALKLFLPMRAVFSTDFTSLRHQGWVFSPRLFFEAKDLFDSPGFEFAVSAGPTFADSAYHSFYYSVEPEFATPSRPGYSAGGGYSWTALTLSLSKPYKDLIFTAFVSMNLLPGSVIEESPLVKKNYAFMSGLMMSWIFMKSTKTVSEER